MSFLEKITSIFDGKTVIIAKTVILHVENTSNSGKEVKIMGDTANFTGNFTGAIINYKTTLTNVQQSIQAIPTANADDKAKLEELVTELMGALEGLPPAKAEQAEAVAQQTQALVEEAKKEKPNKTMLGITANGLKQAAETVADVAPKVLQVATQIVTFFATFGGD